MARCARQARPCPRQSARQSLEVAHWETPRLVQRPATSDRWTGGSRSKAWEAAWEAWKAVGVTRRHPSRALLGARGTHQCERKEPRTPGVRYRQTDGAWISPRPTLLASRIRCFSIARIRGVSPVLHPARSERGPEQCQGACPIGRSEACISRRSAASAICRPRDTPCSPVAAERLASGGAELATETGRAMARVHEKTEFSVSVIGCGRMGCAIAGRAPLSPWGGLGGGRVMIGLRAKVRVMTRRG